MKLVPVMITPFTDAGAIDGAGVDQLVEWYLAQGAGGLFACCLSSEIEALTWEERLLLARRVVARVGGRVPVYAVGSRDAASPQEQGEGVRQMAGTGVDAVVVIASHLVAADQDDRAAVAAHERLADGTAGIPLGVYECPRPYKRLLPPDGVGRLARSGRWIYYKETSCDVAVVAAKVQACAGTPLAVYDAHAAHIAAARAHGAAGCSPVVANLVPAAVARLAEQGDADLQREVAALDALLGPGYPLDVKRALHLLGHAIRPFCRVERPAATWAQAGRLAERVLALNRRLAEG